MYTLELTEEEPRIVHAALHAYLDDFGHEEADVLRAIKKILAKLPVGPSSVIVRLLLWSLGNSKTTPNQLSTEGRKLA